MDRQMMPPQARLVAGAVLALVLLSGCAGPSHQIAAQDTAVAGPEWKVTPRRGVGAASAAAPARLVDVAVEEHERYDRLTFTYTGDRPGYLVLYDSAGAPGQSPALRIILKHATARERRHLASALEAIRDVHQRPAVGDVIETTVAVATPETGADPAFRVGLFVDAFYVDVAHPDWSAAR